MTVSPGCADLQTVRNPKPETLVITPAAAGRWKGSGGSGGTTTFTTRPTSIQ